MAGRMLVATVVCAAALVASAPASGAAPDASCVASWPMYQHDLGHSGSSACSAVNALTVHALVPSWFVRTVGSVTATPSVFDDVVYVGDSTGEFYALDESSGARIWTFSSTDNALHDDQHHAGFGLFTSSPAIARVPGGPADPTVFVGGGGTLFALDARTGHPIWAQDLDPATPESHIEIESSPVVDTSTSPPEVIVGDDDNGGTHVDVTGIQAFNAVSGALLWKYEPEADAVVHSLSGQDGTGDACGDVWSSPALDPAFIDPAGPNSAGRQITASGRSSADGLVVFGTGNCAADPDPATAAAHGDAAVTEGLFGLDAVTGERVWSFFEPPNLYNTGSLTEPGGGDDDFGASPLLVHLPGPGAGTEAVVDGGKSGFVYCLRESDGALLWRTQDAQPGQLGPSLVGSLGGSIGSPSVGTVAGRPVVFLTSAIPLPFTNDGINEHASHPVPCLGTSLPVCPDTSLLTDPTRTMSVHAVDAATGKVLWQAVSLPTYAAASFTNGVVFAPSTVGFSVTAYDAASGLPLWTFPLGAAPSSGVSVAGSRIFLGAGTALETLDGVSLPPQLKGVWSFEVPPALQGVG
ncbi:MAG TPA: PQQ-binding-like beta-propeller repeat protein [Acidimicrobiales bacterium]|nr:PQQ-binding-like beta-propeller repeat protein [Acidimicrobiales bacterium]